MQMQEHADRHAVANILVPMEQAVGISRSVRATGVDEVLRSGGNSSRGGPRPFLSVLGRDSETGLPLAERVNKVVGECAARQATISHLQAEVARCAHMCWPGTSEHSQERSNLLQCLHLHISVLSV